MAPRIVCLICSSFLPWVLLYFLFLQLDYLFKCLFICFNCCFSYCVHFALEVSNSLEDDENKIINIITEVDKEVFCLKLNLNHDITNMIRPITRTGTHFEYTLDHCCPPIPRNTWWINMCALMGPKLRCVIYLNELLLNKRYYLVSGKIIGLYKYFRIGIEWNLSFVVCHLFTMSCLVKRSPSPHVTLSSGSISQIV